MIRFKGKITIPFLLLFLLFAQTSYSQDQDVMEILEIIQKDLKTLERAVYSGSIEIESNTNNQSVSNPDNNSEDVLTRHLLKLSEVEEQFRELTNKFEEINFKLDKLSNRITKIQTDNQLRFQDLESSDVNKSMDTTKKKKKTSYIVKLDKKGKRKWETDFIDEGETLSSFITYHRKQILLTGQKSTKFNGNGDAWLVSLDNKGKQKWQESYGGRGADGGNYATKVSDGGYIMAGYTDSYGNGKNDVWLIKTDFTGEKEWSRVYGGKMDDYGWGVTETLDRGFVVVGETFSYGNGQSDIYIFKVDSSGNKIWDNTFGGMAEDVGYSIANSDDGGYLIASQTRSYGKGGSDGMLVKFDSNGEKEWEKLYGGKGLDYFRSIIKDTKNGYIVSGGTRSFSNGDNQAWILSVDDNGYVIWENTYGDNGEDGFNMVEHSSNNGYIAIGHSSSFFSRGMNDVFMAKIDSLGNKIWQKYHGGKKDDRGYAISQCSDGGYIITG